VKATDLQNETYNGKTSELFSSLGFSMAMYGKRTYMTFKRNKLRQDSTSIGSRRLQQRDQLKDYYMQKKNSRDLASSLRRRAILLLALGAIKDFDIKLRSTAMVVKQQDPALLQIIIFGESRPTSLEEYIALAIIIYLQFIWWPLTGDFFENSLTKFTAIHKFNNFQRKTLMLTTLGASKRKEAEYIVSRSLWQAGLSQTYIRSRGSTHNRSRRLLVFAS
jgi:hypothetical protein